MYLNTRNLLNRLSFTHLTRLHAHFLVCNGTRARLACSNSPLAMASAKGAQRTNRTQKPPPANTNAKCVCQSASGEVACQRGQGGNTTHACGGRAKADVPVEVRAGPEGMGEVRGSSDAGEWGTSIESISGGPSWAGKLAWL
jgi:hypothetical protein